MNSLDARKIIFIVIIVAAVIGVIITGIVVTRTILSRADETISPKNSPSTTKLAPPPSPPKTATPAAAPKPVSPKTSTPSAKTTIPTAPSAPILTSTGWSVSGTGSVDITPSLSVDLKNLYVDFAGTGLNSVTGMDYTLNYTAYPATPRSVKGSFSSPFTRKSVVLGTCSGTTCVYDTNPTNFTLYVLIKSNNGLTVSLKTLTYAGVPVTPQLMAP